ncbi:hypothetical protein, partial [Fretibacterium fastidiosum]|uniref:hypothetical protein n=1 Tax=Fretibacterium fastidiosum TaxID=651822 RepID=UPI001AD8079C
MPTVLSSPSEALRFYHAKSRYSRLFSKRSKKNTWQVLFVTTGLGSSYWTMDKLAIPLERAEER